jgi:hypothetical protein
MARGWESKSIEAQQEAVFERRTSVAAITTEDAALRAERATLSLARTRALADLQCACAPAHRAMLEQAIGDLDRRIAENPNPKTQIPRAALTGESLSF